MSNIANIFQGIGVGKPRMVEMGKIKMGGLADKELTARSGRKYRPPVKYDHFVITTTSRTPDGRLIEDAELMQQLAQEHGSHDGKLRQIPIRVLSDDIDDIMQSAWVWYGGKTVGARGDGKAVTWYNDPSNGKKLAEPRTEEWTDEFADLTDSRGNKLFKLHTVFNCVIASSDSRWGGVYKLRTTSVITARQLYESLLHLSQLTCGVLVGMPLMLVMRPIQVAPQGKATTVYVAHVELRGPDLKQIQSWAIERSRFMVEFKQQVTEAQRQYKQLIVLPGHESDDEAQDIRAEFQPEDNGHEAEGDREPVHDPLLDDEPSDGDIIDADFEPVQNDADDTATESDEPPPSPGGNEPTEHEQLAILLSEIAECSLDDAHARLDEYAHKLAGGSFHSQTDRAWLADVKVKIRNGTITV